MNLNNLKIGSRLGIGFGLLLLSIAMASGGIWYMMHIAALGQQIVASDAEKERIAADVFPGVYGEMAHSINALAASHIDLCRKVVEAVGRYSNGDLSADMENLPRKKAQFTQAVVGVKASSQNVNGEIARLA